MIQSCFFLEGGWGGILTALAYLEPRIVFITQNIGENGGMGGSGELGCEGDSNLPFFSVLGGQKSGFGETQILSCFFRVH